jgi:hypothetical protein
MTQAQVRAFIETFAQTKVDPCLTEAEVDLCLQMAGRADSSCLSPDDPAWFPTYCRWQAVLNAIDIKLAKAQGHIDVSTNGRFFTANQVVQNLMKLRNNATRHIAATVTVALPCSC